MYPEPSLGTLNSSLGAIKEPSINFYFSVLRGRRVASCWVKNASAAYVVASYLCHCKK